MKRIALVLWLSAISGVGTAASGTSWSPPSVLTCFSPGGLYCEPIFDRIVGFGGVNGSGPPYLVAVVSGSDIDIYRHYKGDKFERVLTGVDDDLATSVVAADIDADGTIDLIIGEATNSDGATNGGAIQVYYDMTDARSGTKSDATLLGSTKNANYGLSLDVGLRSAIGDIVAVYGSKKVQKISDLSQGKEPKYLD